jgi:acetyltransferase
MLNLLKKSSDTNSANFESLDTLFYPKSIAIIGASNNTEKIGGFIFQQIKNQASHIKPIPINPTSLEIQGIKAYQDISQIEEENTPDLIIIAIPKQFILQTLNQIIETNKQKKTQIKNIVIITAGFKETGEQGKQEEKQIKELVKTHNLNLIGPNCLGFLNPEINLNCSFAKDIPKSGNTALISQSGAVIDAIIDWSFQSNIGFSKIVSLGNMAGIDELKILQYLKDDKETKSIVFYMETLEKGKKFGELLKEISKTKPVIIIKPGTSKQAKSAIGSHTGSLAQDNILVETLIEQNNGILVKNLNELFNMLIGLKNIDKIKTTKQSKHNKETIILTNAGGPGVIATDELASTNQIQNNNQNENQKQNTGLNLYQLSEKQKKQLQKKLPQEASLNNPIDILGDAKSDRYTSTLKELLKIKDLENIIILLTPQIMTDSENIAKSIIELSKKDNKYNKLNKNIFTAFLGHKEVKHAKTLFNISDLPTFDTPNEVISTLDKLVKYKSFNYITSNNSKNKKQKNETTSKFKTESIKNLQSKLQTKINNNETGLLDQKLTNKILKSLNIKPFEKQFIENEHDIFKLKIVSNQNYVIKADAKELIHKKEFNAIKLNINSTNYKEEIHKMLKNIKMISQKFTITIEQQIQGIETIVGLKQDRELGNFILFGMGGTYVNLFKDVNVSQAPLNKLQTKQLIQKSKVSKLLNGYRGDKTVNLKALEKTIENISYIQEIYPQIKEVDFNPIICDEHDCYLVDVKLIL